MAHTDRSLTMTDLSKPYSAPQLEALSLRSTRDIEIHVGILDFDLSVSVSGLPELLS
jgi:hypothetical protein